MTAQAVAVCGYEAVEKSGDRRSEPAAARAEYLVQARREIRFVGADVPIPQAYTCSFRGQGIALFAFPKSCLCSPEFSDIANRSDQAQRFAMLVKRGFGALEDSTDLAVRTDDAVLDFELLPREAGSGIGFSDPPPIIGMDVLEIFLLGPSPSAGTESEDTQTFIGPTDVVRREIEHPTSNRGNALSLYQLAVAFSQPSFCPGPFDCLGNQRCR